MTYLRRSNPAQRRGRAATIAISVSLLILFGIHYLFPGFYPALLYPVSSLAWKSENRAVRFIAGMADILRSKSSLIRENAGLRREISANQSSLLLLDAVARENEELKSILGRKPSEAVILSVVLARPPVSPYDTLVIDRGTVHGIEVGDRVYAEGDVLLGEIAEAYARESKVALLSTPGKRTAITFSETGLNIDAIGRGGGNYQATAPAEAGVKEGDIAVISGTRAVSIGVVENVTLDKSGSFSLILFKSPVSMQGLRYVEVEASGKKI